LQVDAALLARTVVFRVAGEILLSVEIYTFGTVFARAAFFAVVVVDCRPAFRAIAFNPVVIQDSPAPTAKGIAANLRVITRIVDDPHTACGAVLVGVHDVIPTE